MFYTPLLPHLHFSLTALLSFILSSFQLCLLSFCDSLLINQCSMPLSFSSVPLEVSDWWDCRPGTSRSAQQVNILRT